MRDEGGHRVSPLLVLCVAQFVLQLDFSIVNVALKTIQGELGFSATGLQWVATSYALTFGSLLLLGGRLGDLVDRRRLLTWGLVVFGLASIACGLAQSPAMLVCARFVQGAGAAAVSPTVLAILTSIYSDGQARSRALATWTAALAAGGTAGIIAGGILTEYLGWRSIFLVNVPLIAILIPLVLAVLPPAPATAKRRLDVRGAVQISLAVAALIFGVTNGEQHGFGTPLTLANLIGAALLLCGFVLTERRVAEPMVSLPFLAVPVRRTSATAMFLIGGAVAAYAYFIALYLQRVLGLSEGQTGLALIPSAGTMALISMFAAHSVIRRLGLKRALIAAVLLIAVGQFTFTRLGAGSDYFVDVMPGMLINACGMGVAFTGVSIGITRNVEVADQGIAGGLVPASQQIGSAIVLALLATLAALVTSHGDGSLIPGYRAAFLAMSGIALAVAALVTLTSFRGVEVVAVEQPPPALPAE